MKSLLLASSLAFVLLSGCAAADAQPPPVQDIPRYRRSNLADAQDALRLAFDRIVAAQESIHSLQGGHAAHAKDLVREASMELSLADLNAGPP